MGAVCPSRASVVRLGGWYFEPGYNKRGHYFHVAVEVSDGIPGGVRGSGRLIPPNHVEVRFVHKPHRVQTGTIQPDGSIRWDNGKTWTYGDAREQRWAPPGPGAPCSWNESPPPAPEPAEKTLRQKRDEMTAKEERAEQRVEPAAEEVRADAEEEGDDWDEKTAAQEEKTAAKEKEA